MTNASKPSRFPYRVQATHDITLVSGVTIPSGTLGWLVGYTNLWNDPDVNFDGLGWCGVTSEDIQAVRIDGRLVRRT